MMADNGGTDHCTNNNTKGKCSNFGETSATKVRPAPPFVIKVYDMVQEPLFDSIISWGADGTSFIVQDPQRFAAEVLPLYFKHNNFTSFNVQLNTYCFKKIRCDRWEFQNERFQKGKSCWLKYITRRNQIPKYPQLLTGGEPSVDLIPSEMVKEIEHLRQQQSDLKVEIAEMKEIYERQMQELDKLQKRGQLAVLQRDLIAKLMNEAVLKLKRELCYGGEGSERHSSISRSIQSSLLDTNASICKLLEKELMEEDLNNENLSEDEVAKLHSFLAMQMKDY